MCLPSVREVLKRVSASGQHEGGYHLLSMSSGNVSAIAMYTNNMQVRKPRVILTRIIKNYWSVVLCRAFAPAKGRRTAKFQAC